MTDAVRRGQQVWLATGLYIAPLLSGREPKLQKLGVDYAFWIGNQGLEFTSMGRALRRPAQTRRLIAMVFLSAVCIGGFLLNSVPAVQGGVVDTA